MRTQHPSPERLESRVAPAGLVAVSVVGGVLQLNSVPGSDGAEVVSVTTLHDGTYLVAPGVDVVLRIGGTDFTTPQAVAGVTKGLSASLGLGNDQLDLVAAAFTGAVSVNLGAGTNKLALYNTAIGGGLNVVGGENGDTIAVTGDFLRVGGAVRFTLGAGPDAVETTVDSINVGGGVKIDIGTGADQVEMGDSSRDLSVQGGFHITGGAGDQEVVLGAATGRLTVLGALQIKLGDGDDEVTVAGERINLRSALLDLGNGADTVTLGSPDRNMQILGALVVNLGEGNDNLTLTSDGIALRSALLNFGNGTNTLTMGTEDSSIQIAQAFKILAGNGNHNFNVVGATGTFGSVQFSLGAGNHNVTFAMFHAQILGDLRWSSGDGNSTLATQLPGPLLTSLAVGGNVLVSFKNGVSEFSLRASDLTVAGKVDMRAGDSPVNDGRFSIDGTFVDLGSSVFIKTGANGGLVGLSTNETHVVGNITVLAGPGTSFVQLFCQGPSTFLGNITARKADATGSIGAPLSQSVVRGALTMTGGSTIFLEPGLMLGPVKIATLAAGLIAVDPGGRLLRTLDISMPSADGASGTIQIGDGPIDDALFLEGGLKIRGGAGNDTVRINDTAVFGSTLIDLGAGTDSIELETINREGPTTFRGSVRLLGGSGTDNFSFGSAFASNLLQFLASVIVDGGAGTDTLNIATSTTFAVSGDPVQLNFP